MFIRNVAAPLTLIVLSGGALAQDNPQTVGVSVEGTVVEIPVDLAAQACGIDAETLLAEWDALGTEIGTMAETSVQADATDLAPEVAVDTPMDSAIDGETVADGADSTHGTDGEAAQDIASDVNAGSGGDMADVSGVAAVSDVQATAADTEPGAVLEVPMDGSMDAGVEVTAQSGATGDDPATADVATASEAASAGTAQEATGGPATPTEGTTLSKAAVCQVSEETADALGIAMPG